MELDQRVNPVVKALVAIITLICLVFAHSFYLIIIITILAAIFAFIEIKSVNEFIILLKNFFLLLLIISLIIIIVLGSFRVKAIFIMLYKIFISSIIIVTLDSCISFIDLHSTVYRLFYRIKFLNYKKISLEIVLFIMFIKKFINSKNDIIAIQRFNNKTSFRIKYYFFPRILRSIKEIDDLRLNLKLNFYEVQHKKLNLKSKILLIAFIVFLIVCVIKEVIL